MASKQGRRRRYTPEDFVEILAEYEAGGYEGVAKAHSLTEPSARTLVNKARRVAPVKKRTGKKPPKPSPMILTKAIGAYISECQAGYLNGSGKVSLGALAGFPGTTTDPETVRRAIEVVRGRIAETKTVIAELKARQRLRDLERALEALEARAKGSQYRDIFVAYGAEWAEGAGIDYETFRDMGLSAEVLREAGITRAG